MKSHMEYSTKGRFQFVLDEPLPLGKHFMHLGKRVKVVGHGIAGMPEVEQEDGYTYCVFPHELKPEQDASGNK